ncbi:MAG: SWIM zinc finger family protein [Pyrinomonadaceae bacterium]
MFILKSVETIQKAIERARAIRPRVRSVRFGRYEVSGSRGGYYTVMCYRNRGQRVVDCTCKAGESGRPCFHAAAAVGLHLWTATTPLATSH